MNSRAGEMKWQVGWKRSKKRKGKKGRRRKEIKITGEGEEEINFKEIKIKRNLKEGRGKWRVKENNLKIKRIFCSFEGNKNGKRKERKKWKTERKEKKWILET